MKIDKIISLLFITAIFTLPCCIGQKAGNMKRNKTPDPSSGENKYIISAPIVAKTFVKKNGQSTDRKEYYIQRSIQDYFIKFCESEVSLEELEEALSKSDSFIKTLKLEIEYKNGEWDVCNENEEQQSRIGEYVIVHRII